MITPRFTLSQDENYVHISIHAPFSRISDAEIYMDGPDFRFHSNPYYIRLNLPGDIVDNDEAKAHFDAATNEFKIKCPKVVKGTHFEGLDMLTSLLQPKGQRDIGEKSIEVVGASSDEINEEEDESQDEQFDWLIEQEIQTESEESLSGSKYGFGLKHSGLFSKLAEELHQVVDVQNPDTQPLAERRTERLEQEKKEFNPEHYLADFFQTDSIDPLISFKSTAETIKGEWSEEDQNCLKNFANKEYLMDHDTLQLTYLGLVDILLSYCYDSRTTMADPTVESAWTIAKLSGTLSWFEIFSSIRQVAICFMRRSLCFPLYRNYKLSLKAVEDTAAILKSGRSSVLKCLLTVYQLFNKSEPRYLLNQLYIQDYCVWVQNCSNETLASLSESLRTMTLTKEDVDLNLTDLEQAAVNLMCHSSDEEDDSDLEDQLARLSINKTKKNSPQAGAYPMDLLVAAEAARASSSDSELDSDDLSSSEESD